MLCHHHRKDLRNDLTAGGTKAGRLSAYFRYAWLKRLAQDTYRAQNASNAADDEIAYRNHLRCWGGTDQQSIRSLRGLSVAYTDTTASLRRCYLKYRKPPSASYSPKISAASSHVISSSSFSDSISCSFAFSDATSSNFIASEAVAI